MDAEIKRKWVEALRSGKYAQTKSHLRDEHGYCCLGVLCDLIAPNDWQSNVEDDVFKHRRANSFPHPEVLATAGIEGNTDCDEPVHPLWTAAHMNDDGRTFAEIADYIEGYL